MNRVQIAILGVTALAFGGAYVLFNTGQAPQQIIQIAPKVDTDEVLVAAHDVPMGTQLTDADYTWQKWPNAALSELMIKKSEGPQVVADAVKGAVTRNSFLQGEPMRRDKLIKGANGGFLSAILPSGMRAVAINIDQTGSSTAGGFILPNDRVDVIKVFHDDEQTKLRGADVSNVQTILTNVRVLAIGQNIQEKNGEKTVIGANATLELDPEQVEQIILAQRTGGGLGSLQLALRSMLDSTGKTALSGEARDKGGLTIVRAGTPQQAAR
jgi:pilus assembly protein CpaB